MTWATSMPILVFLDLSVLDLGPIYATDRQTSDAHHRLMPPTLGAGHNKYQRQLEGYTAYRSGVTRTAHAMACVTCTVVYTPMGVNGFIRKITPPTLLWAMAHFTYLTASGKIYPAFACRPPQTSIPRAWSVDERLIYYNYSNATMHIRTCAWYAMLPQSDTGGDSLQLTLRLTTDT